MGVPLSHPFLFGIFLINHEAIGVLHLSPYDPVIQHRICFQGAASWSSPFTSRIQQKIHNEPWDNDWRWFDFLNLVGIFEICSESPTKSHGSWGVLRTRRDFPSRCSPIMADPRHLCFEHSSLGTGPHHLQNSDLASMAVGDLKLRRIHSGSNISNRNPIGIQEFGCHFAWCLNQFAWRLMAFSEHVTHRDSVVSWVLSTHFTSSTLMASGRGGKSRACGKFESFSGHD